jgi:23S rRNA pseudouridine2605 synthase
MTDTPRPDSDAPKAERTATERVAKVIARSGYASRRDAEKLILAGRVTVNGKTIDSPALDVAPRDKVAIDGKPIDAPQETRLWLYYKPLGLVTTEKDDQGRRTIFDELPEGMPRVLNVGRLDLNSEGLLLLTNDGGLKRRLELPETGWLRKYRVRVNGRPTEQSFDPLRAGITIDGEDFQPMEITIDRQQGANAWLTVGIREGKNREIRRAMTEVGLTVNRLIRISYGPFRLNDMTPGDVMEVRRRMLRDQLGERLLTGEGEDKPTRAPRGEGDRPARKPRFGDRPERGERPDRGDRPARKSFGDRPERGERGDRPARKSFGDRPERDGAQKGFGRQRDFGPRGDAEGEERARKPRWGGNDRSDAPKRSEGFKPREDRPRRDWEPRDGKPGGKPRGEGFKPRAEGERPRGKSDGFKSFGGPQGKPRGEGFKSHGGEGRNDSRGEGRDGYKPRGSWDNRGEGRPERGEGKGPRGEGFKPRGEGKPRGEWQPREGKPGGKPRSEGFRSHGGKPGGKPGSEGGKPRSEGFRSHGGKPGGKPGAGGKPRTDGFKSHGPKGGSKSGPRPPRKD